jgi:hypothetical protein
MSRLPVIAFACALLLAIAHVPPALTQDHNHQAGYDGITGTSPTPPMDGAACAPEALCGNVGPDPNTHWIADGEWDPAQDLLGFITVDATTSRIVFMDPNTCTVFFSCTPAFFATSYRAFAWGINGGDMWVSGWNPPVALFHIDFACNLIQQFDVGVEIAGLAMDFANGHLWAMRRSPVGGATSALLEYDINSGTPVLIQGPLPVNWGGGGEGIGSAGLEYDNSTCSIVALRQDSNNVGQSFIEVFADLDPAGAGGIFWLNNCDITTTQHCTGQGTFINHPWGLAVKDNAPLTRKVIVTDINLGAACAIPAAGEGPVDFHYYPLPTAPPSCATTAVEPATWGQIKAIHR